MRSSRRCRARSSSPSCSRRRDRSRRTHMSRRRDDVWRRRWLALGIAAALSIVLPLVSGHRGTHMAMNLLLPGAGLFGVHTLAAIGFVLLAIAALGLWLRWGMDWTVVMVLIAAMVASAIAVHDHTATALAPQRSAHEFPLVILIVGALVARRTLVAPVPADRRAPSASGGAPSWVERARPRRSLPGGEHRRARRRRHRRRRHRTRHPPPRPARRHRRPGPLRRRPVARRPRPRPQRPRADRPARRSLRRRRRGHCGRRAVQRAGLAAAARRDGRRGDAAPRSGSPTP